MAVEKFDLTGLQEATVAGDNTMLLINTEAGPSIGRQPRKITKANLLAGVGGGGGVSLPADAAGALVNDGAGNLSWSPEQDLIWENAAGIIQPNGVGANTNAISFDVDGRTLIGVDAANFASGPGLFVVNINDNAATYISLMAVRPDFNIQGEIKLKASFIDGADDASSELLQSLYNVAGTTVDSWWSAHVAGATPTFQAGVTLNGNLVWAFDPSVADGASAVAYLFDTSNALTTASAKLLAVQTAGDLVMSLQRTGNFGGGYLLQLLPDGGVVADDGTTIRVGDDGGGFRVRYGLSPTLLAHVDIYLNQTKPVVALENYSPYKLLMLLDPGQDYGQEPYVFNTQGVVASGPLVTFQNNNTEKFSVNVDGNLFVQTVQVVGPRVIDARIDDAIASGDATTDGVIDAIRDALITHGLIAAA